MGKACVRFKKLENVALEVVGEAIRRIPARAYIARYEAVLADVARRRTKGPAKKASKASAARSKARSTARKARG